MRLGIAIVFASLLLTGCGTVLRAPSEPRTPINRAPTENAATGNTEAASPGANDLSRNTAATTLLNQGRADRDAGNYTQAGAAIERALGIDPNNAALWIELAEIRFAESDLEQAEALARKTLTLASGDRGIIERANRLIRR